MDEFVKTATPVPFLMREPEPPIGESTVVMTPELVSKVPLELIVMVRVAGRVKEAVVLRVPLPKVRGAEEAPILALVLICSEPELIVVVPV